MMRHAGSIIVVIVVVHLSLPTEILRTFVFVGTSILWNYQLSAFGFAERSRTY